ncbi:hexose transporter 1-like isoform X2 [Eurosta solidaginis]|uniref:hexose transporter 1-like isoform X2 n=1 Tax=Eurosta solidaginis TaxID=178769 RepID=UPI003530FC08
MNGSTQLPTTYGQTPEEQIPNFGQQPSEWQPNAVKGSTATSVPPNFTTAQAAAELSQNTLGNSSFTRHQLSSTGSASFILITGGMNIAWSCGFAAIIGYQLDTHIIICWYIAAIIGAIVGSLITHRMATKPINMFSAFLVLIGGIIFVSAPHKYNAIAAARYLNGFGVGLVIIPTLVLVGEEVHSGARGLAASIIEMGAITLGIFLQIIFVAAFELTSDTIFYGYGFGSTHLNESPIYYLLRNDETQAVECLNNLQHPHSVRQELEEQKRYIESNSPAGDLAISALLNLCLYRSLIALSFSTFTTAGIQLASVKYLGPGLVWAYIIFGLMLWFGCFLSSFLMDSVGRKKLMLGSALLCGCLATGVGIIYNDLENIVYNYHMGMALYMLFGQELFAGIFRSVCSAYLTEAFPLHQKPYYIGIAFIVEMLVMLITASCVISVGNLGSYFLAFGILYLVYFAMGFVLLPETQKLTLREAQDKFKNFGISM